MKYEIFLRPESARANGGAMRMHVAQTQSVEGWRLIMRFLRMCIFVMVITALGVVGIVGCARYDLFESYKEKAVKNYEESKARPVVSDESEDDGREGASAEIGWMRPSRPTTYTALGDKFGVEGSQIAKINWDYVENTVPAGKLVLIPLSNSTLLESVSDSDLLRIRASVHSGIEKAYTYNTADSNATAIGQDTHGVIKAVNEIVGNSSEIDAKMLGGNFARLIGRAVADSAVESVRDLPWVKALEVEYKIPIGSDVGTIGADALIALHEIDEDGHFVFSQIGGRYKKDRFMGNWGVGYRRLSQDKSWMWGSNAFIDYDFMGEHVRGGLGAEVKTNLLDFYTNYYVPLSPWKKAYRYEYLEERAARGFDLGVAGRLSFLQSVDWKVKYFRWFGENVDVFGDSKYLTNPDGVELGATWSPWKSIKLGVMHSRALGTTLQETRVEGQFSANFDELGSLFERTKTGEGTAVSERMSQLVTRQNEMVFERRVSAEGVAVGIVITKFERQ